MIKHDREQFYLSANEFVDNLSKTDAKSYWSLIKRLMKGSNNSFTIPPLFDENSQQYVYDDKSKANLLNEYFCSISDLDDSNREPPDLPRRTQSTLTSIEINIQEVKDILKVLKIGKACGDDVLAIKC